MWTIDSVAVSDEAFSAIENGRLSKAAFWVKSRGERF
jgi:hypothetical protein